MSDDAPPEEQESSLKRTAGEIAKLNSVQLPPNMKRSLLSVDKIAGLDAGTLAAVKSRLGQLDNVSKYARAAGERATTSAISASRIRVDLEGMRRAGDQAEDDRRNELLIAAIDRAAAASDRAAEAAKRSNLEVGLFCTAVGLVGGFILRVVTGG